MEAADKPSIASALVALTAIKKEKWQPEAMHASATEFQEMTVKIEPLQCLQAEIESADTATVALIPQTHECLKEEFILGDELSVATSHFQEHNQNILLAGDYEQAVASTAKKDSKAHKRSPRRDSKVSIETQQSQSNCKQGFECGFCPKTFAKTGHLKRHMVMHAKDRKREFTCHLCEMAFYSNGNLVTHMKIHTGGTHKDADSVQAGKEHAVVVDDAQRPGDSTERKDQLQLNAKLVHVEFACHLCPKKLSTRNSLRDHIRLHTGDMFNCKVCDRRFTKKSNQLAHMRRKHSAGSSTNAGHLKSQRKREFACHLCSKKLSTNTYLQEHIRLHTGDTFNCEICEVRCNKRANLMRHMRQKHQSPAAIASPLNSNDDSVQTPVPNLRVSRLEDSVNCEVCFQSFPKEFIESHKLIAHDRNTFKCKVCPRSFTKAEYLKNHMIRHAKQGNREFACHLCSKKLSTYSVLQAHIRLHTGDKLNCKLCEARYTKKSNLLRHIQLKHPSRTLNDAAVHPKTELMSDEEFLGEENVENSAQANEEESATVVLPTHCVTCEVCHKNYTKEFIGQHMRVAHGEKTIKCELCRRSFTNAEHLRKHMVTHAKDRKRDFICPSCGMAFYTKANLGTHMWTHSDATHSCDLCGKVYRQKPKLKRHMLRQHSDGKHQSASTPLTSGDISIQSKDKNHHQTGPQTSEDISVHMKRELMSDEEFLDEGNSEDSAVGAQTSNEDFVHTKTEFSSDEEFLDDAGSAQVS